jgi:hypothetical protein
MRMPRATANTQKCGKKNPSATLFLTCLPCFPNLVSFFAQRRFTDRLRRRPWESIPSWGSPSMRCPDTRMRSMNMLFFPCFRYAQGCHGEGIVACKTTTTLDTQASTPCSMSRRSAPCESLFPQLIVEVRGRQGALHRNTTTPWHR